MCFFYAFSGLFLASLTAFQGVFQMMFGFSKFFYIGSSKLLKEF